MIRQTLPLVLGWDGEQWAYATVERWASDDGSRIIPAKELLGDLAGLDDPRRPPRCGNTSQSKAVRWVRKSESGLQTVTLPETATRGTLITVDGFTWEAVWEGEHFFWERVTGECSP